MTNRNPTPVRLKYVARIIMGQSPESDDCNDQGDGTPFLQGCAEFGPIYPEPRLYCPLPRKVAPRGAVLISVRAPVGTINVANADYGIGRGLCAVVAVDGRSDSSFLYYQLSSAKQALHSVATGSTYNAVSTSDLGNLLVPPLPTEAQAAIGAFLHHETAAIDGLVRKKESMIELLEEKKAAYISRVVTQGLDPTAPTRDSGLKAFGRVPAHWKACALKRLIKLGCVNGLFKTRDAFGSGVLFLNVVDIYQRSFQVAWQSLERAQATREEVIQYSVERGDIFFVRSSLKLGGVGQSALAPAPVEPAVFDCHLVRVRPDQLLVNPRFLVSFLNSPAARSELVSRANTVTMATLDQEKIASLPILLPPLQEQRRLTEQIDVVSKRTESLVNSTRSTIARLSEYRAALITAAVTGQLDIRKHEKQMEAIA